MTDSEVLDIKKRYYTRIMDVYRKKGIYIPGLPTLIRTALRVKVAKDRLKINAFCRAGEKEMREWFDGKSVFFGFGLIRSGTTFLANFLNQTVPDAVVGHETNVVDYWYYPLALQSEAEAEKYIHDYRLAEIFYRMRSWQGDLYGEINPFLRRHCRALQKHLPQARFFHLVRDGRKVVRSIMSRQTLDRTDPVGHLIRPPRDDPYAPTWEKMSRFEKICWLWQSDNRYMRESTGTTLSFERLVTDWDYFKSGLADYIGIHIPQEVWQSYSKRVGNPTPTFRMGQWSSWASLERDQFIAICGNEMKACGYEID
jgi:hypothetical protein